MRNKKSRSKRSIQTDTAIGTSHYVVPERSACQSCGTSEGVVLAADPYQSDVNNDDRPVWMCESCRRESAENI
jgi:hypothetical protein